jgi:hypothetical protein
MFAELLKVYLLPGSEYKTVLLDEVGWWQTLKQRLNGNQQYTLFYLWQAIQDLQTMRDDVLMGREHVVGQGLPVRQAQDFQIPVTAEESYALLEFYSPVGIRDQYQGQSIKACCC